MDKSNKKNKTNKKYKKKNKISKKLECIPNVLTKSAFDYEIFKTDYEEGIMNVKIFEEKVTQLLLIIDSVEINGIEKIRTYRKELVKYITEDFK